MTLWWIANVLLLLVVIPVVAFLLHKLREPVLEIKAYADDILEHGVGTIAELDAVDELVETRQRVGVLKDQVITYGRAVARILG